MKNLKSLLMKPSQEYKLWALWIWNKTISLDEMHDQLQSFISKGFAGVAIRPSRDMVPSYLSEEFFNLFEDVLKNAKSHNFKIRIADDFSIPWSGFFQTQAEQNTSFRAQKLELFQSKLFTAKEVFEFTVPDKNIYTVLAAKSNNGQINANNVKNLQVGSKSNNISWKVPAGEWQVIIFKKSWYLDPLGNYVPNVFNPKVAQFYIQSVLEKIRTKFSKYIPNTFEGFICEMPSYLPSNNGIPWDDDLIIKYRSRYKKNLINVVPSLFFEVNDCFAKNRSHVYNFILQAMFERFPSVLETWSKKYNISQWVLSAERDINWFDNTLKDVMSIPSANLSSIGLQNHDGTEKDFSVVKAMADMNSVEHKRETIGVIGRNRRGISSTIQSLKNEIDLHSFLETSKLILDGCFFNLDQRNYIKTPFNLSWYHPDWDQMENLCNYTTRLFSISNTLTYIKPVAVVMPSLSVMADYFPSNDEALRRGMSIFHKILEDLYAHNIQFDIISEQFLISCTIRPNGEFGSLSKNRKHNYRAVIFPFSRLINNSTFVFLEKLTIKKGTIIFINEAPQGNFDDGQSSSFSARVAKITRQKNETVHVVPLMDFITRLQHIENPISIKVNEKPCPDIRVTYGYGTDYNIYFFNNCSSKKDYFASLEFPISEHVYLVDCFDGNFYEIENVECNEKLCYIELNFAPKQTYIILTSSTKIQGLTSSKNRPHVINSYATLNRNYRIVLKDRWIFSHDNYNALPLASWNARIGLSRDSGGFSHFYESYFESEEVPEVCILAFPGVTSDDIYSNTVNDNLKALELSVNGITISPFKPVVADEMEESLINTIEFCGKMTLKYDIKGAVMKGINRVSLRTIGFFNDPYSIYYPPIVAGPFSIKKGSRGWTIDTSKTEANYGSWTKYGFPYFSGSGVYQQVFEIPTDYEKIVLMFKEISGSVLAEVNGVSFDIINWQPMSIDITKAIEPRRNILKIKVSNTIDNLLRMNGRASGFTGEVYLDIY